MSAVCLHLEIVMTDFSCLFTFSIQSSAVYWYLQLFVFISSYLLTYWQFWLQLFIYILSSKVSCLVTFYAQSSAFYWHFQLFVYLLTVLTSAVNWHFQLKLQRLFTFSEKNHIWKVWTTYRLLPHCVLWKYRKNGWMYSKESSLSLFNKTGKTS